MVFEQCKDRGGCPIITGRHREILLLAGPGTGKSTCLACVLTHILDSQSECPASPRILAVTFTNAAANDLKKKTAGILGRPIDGDIRISTLHSLAVGILKRLLGQDFCIASRDDYQLLRRELEAKGVANPFGKGERWFNRLYEEYCKSRADAFDPLTGLENEDIPPYLLRFCDTFEKLLNEYNALSWVQIPYLTARKISVSPGSVNKYDFVLIDEFQDLTKTEQFIGLRIVKAAGQLIIAGDDDQSIYGGFRYAYPEGIVRLYNNDRFFKPPRNESRRIPGNILHKANNLITYNEGRVKKNPLTPTPENERSGAVDIVSFINAETETDFIAREAAAAADKRKSVFILCTGQEPITTPLIRILGNLGDVFKNCLYTSDFKIRRLIIIWRLLVNTGDSLALRWLLEDQISPYMVKKLKNISTTDDIHLWTALKLFIAGKCNKVRGLEYLKGLGEFVDRLRTDLNNNERLSVISEYSTISNLAERDVAVIAGRIDPVLLDSSDRRSLLEFIRRLERPELETTEPGFIYLTTIHGAKGLEADLVLIPGFEQQVIPDGFEINEQRRLIYVGLTRTKESLRFTRSDYREPNGFRLKNDTWEYSNRRPSQFVIEMEAPNITGL